MDIDEKEVKRQILDKWIVQRNNLNQLIAALQAELGDPVNTDITPGTGGMNFSGNTGGVAATAGKLQGRPDEFFGMSQSEAAAAYLKKVGHAVHLDQILEALRAGGVKFEGKEPKTNLYTVLVRGTRRFVLVSPSTFGLMEFYPNRKAGKE
jgi:hypothetical protein